jgi:4-amino-4-deoxy-L-arabinose transferase-like glycosyltransferase
MKWNDPHATLLWARLPILLLTLLLGYVLYTLGVRLGGPWGGLLCLAVYVTTPAFLAFGPLVVTDVAFTLFWILTVWQLPSMWHSPQPSQILTFGLAFAGALLSKFSSGLLLFAFVAVPISLRLLPLPEQPS